MSRLEALEDLKYAMEYNNLDFTFEKVKAIRAYILGERDESSWEWVVELNNGCYYYVVGWCDYTGWDCQSGLNATIITSTAHLLRVIREESRDADTMFEMLDKE